MVWIVEWTQHGDNVSYVTAHSSEEYALASACASIMRYIKSDWNFLDAATAEHALKVSDACAAGKWKEAITLYNDQENIGLKKSRQHFAVYERTIDAQAFPVINLLSRASMPKPAAPAPTKPQAWKATAPGATCRGPCQQVSTDAYADQPDGTYHCYQCRMFSQVFGKKP